MPASHRLQILDETRANVAWAEEYTLLEDQALVQVKGIFREHELTGLGKIQWQESSVVPCRVKVPSVDECSSCNFDPGTVAPCRIETPNDRAFGYESSFDRELGRNKWAVRPIQQTRGRSVML